MFQFLSRNSVRWDFELPLPTRDAAESFNSSVGILSVGTRVCGLSAPISRCFNSSVGILSVGTLYELLLPKLFEFVSIPQSEFCPLGLSCAALPASSIPKFQFLSRNSVRWDP